VVLRETSRASSWDEGRKKMVAASVLHRSKSRPRRTLPYDNLKTEDRTLNGGDALTGCLYLKLFHYFPPFRIFPVPDGSNSIWSS